MRTTAWLVVLPIFALLVGCGSYSPDTPTESPENFAVDPGPDDREQPEPQPLPEPESNPITPPDDPGLVPGDTCWEMVLEAYVRSLSYVLVVSLHCSIHSLEGGRTWDDIHCEPEGQGSFDYAFTDPVLVVEATEVDPESAVVTIRGYASGNGIPEYQPELAVITYDFELELNFSETSFVGVGLAGGWIELMAEGERVVTVPGNGGTSPCP